MDTDLGLFLSCCAYKHTCKLPVHATLSTLLVQYIVHMYMTECVCVCMCVPNYHDIHTINNKKYYSDNQFFYIVHILTWRAQKMRSATSLELTIGQNCAVCTKSLGHRDAFSSMSERRKHHAF